MSNDFQKKKSGLPLFYQIASVLRHRIDSGVWRPGMRIPSLEELVVEFSVARTTVRQAVTQLEEEGLIWRKQGKGTFVNEPEEDPFKLNLQADWVEIMEFFEGSEINMLQFKKEATLPFLDDSAMEAADSYVYMKRLHSIKQKLRCAIDVYLDAAIYETRSEEFDQNIILRAFKEMPELNIKSARQRLTIGMADLENANLLGMPVNDPIVKARRTLTNQDNKIIYLSDTVYPSKYLVIDMDMNYHRTAPKRTRTGKKT
ncbi:MAG: GntR family transcriptional regulator [Deltaproteobacteria bacterium]|jgi:GntR family transcriptional regulator|nr:GntR family transcriptional regulator [Deltaproteobacteria bacterium]MBT4637434.1 GntR family transcriptional regulator [Deltaproteobacteria bacterium]MBT6504002.1 GntR family transcriptional regulator [Deltaproteobacteria bacterium]MBT6615218.1 GntR family transcriptional regulator [Deltaproteobacteria bacterium]MBT7155786.1 GntR family transcriptional regulator [Deltaproteobacteria bacterium]